MWGAHSHCGRSVGARNYVRSSFSQWALRATRSWNSASFYRDPSVLAIKLSSYRMGFRTRQLPWLTAMWKKLGRNYNGMVKSAKYLIQRSESIALIDSSECTAYMHFLTHYIGLYTLRIRARSYVNNKLDLICPVRSRWHMHATVSSHMPYLPTCPFSQDMQC